MVRGYQPVARSERRTSADTGNSRKFCLPARGRRICAAGAYWPGQTLWREREREQRREPGLRSGAAFHSNPARAPPAT